MSAPKGLLVKSKIENMSIGDCIPFKYLATTSGAIGGISELGTYTGTEIPFTGSATPNGLAYFIKVDKGLLICDRVVQHSITWDALNYAGLVHGKIILPKVINSFSNYVYSDLFPANMFDGNLATQWHSTAVLPHNAEFTYDSTFTPVEYSIISANQNSIKSWTIDGYIDGQWVTIDSQINANQFADNEKRRYKISTNKSFSKYRINVTDAYRTDPYTSIYELSIIPDSKTNVIVRSLSGGCAFIGANGIPNKIDAGLGAWPLNEWDKYIASSDLGGKITPGDNNIWHYVEGAYYGSYCKDTIINDIFNNSAARVLRGSNGESKGFTYNVTSQYAPTLGFRPVLQYVESKQKTIWY